MNIRETSVSENIDHSKEIQMMLAELE